MSSGTRHVRCSARLRWPSRLRLFGFTTIMLLATACTDSTDSVSATHSEPVATTTDIELPPVSAAVMAMWARNCALCHVRGEGGAPQMADRSAWSERLNQGEDTLLAHTIEGFNNMPPLGYCMECEREDLLTLIRFMAGGS